MNDKELLYRETFAMLSALLEGEKAPMPQLCNTAALIWQALPQLNWAGFYLYRDGGLLLGPFQGKPACIRIAMGRGVCGTAAERRETVLVPNVHRFPGHIACDSASNSEIVIPLILPDGRLVGVLDLDSPILDRFDETDRAGLEAMMAVLLNSCVWPDASEGEMLI